jgi:hypothetical protein
VEDVLAHKQANTEIVVVLDGAWPEPALPFHADLKVVFQPESIGQRGAVNYAAKLSDAKYLMKLDAHCAVDYGFDVKLIEAGDALGLDVTQIPRMYNLHVFDWKCNACGHQAYMGPTPTACGKCASTQGFTQVAVWQRRMSRVSDFARFDRELHFQYHGEYKHRAYVIAEGDIADCMSSIGACWFMPRERFWQLGGMDEAHGSWGQFGTEIACKSWLSGGRQVVNKRTWFAHMFRTQPGFSFPYDLSGNQVNRARKYSQDLWLNNRWPGQVRPLSWLIEKFAPLPDWHQEIGKEALAQVMEAGKVFEATHVHSTESSTRNTDSRPAGADGSCDEPEVLSVVAPRVTPTKGLIYYSDCRGDEDILHAVQRQLEKCANGHEIVTATLKPISFGHRRIVLPLERGYLTMFKQILAALEASTADIVFFCEHDVLYAPSYFDFTPSRMDTVFYNQNCWKVNAVTGHALFYRCNQTSQLCGSRELLLQHYRARVARVERDGFSRQMGFEPGTRKTRHGGVDDTRYEEWMAPVPNIDIRHGSNLTSSRWRQDALRNQKFCQGWVEGSSVPSWGVTEGRFPEFLQEVTR